MPFHASSFTLPLYRIKNASKLYELCGNRILNKHTAAKYISDVIKTTTFVYNMQRDRVPFFMPKF